MKKRDEIDDDRTQLTTWLATERARRLIFHLGSVCAGAGTDVVVVSLFFVVVEPSGLVVVLSVVSVLVLLPSAFVVEVWVRVVVVDAGGVPAQPNNIADMTKPKIGIKRVELVIMQYKIAKRMPEPLRVALGSKAGA